VSEDSNYYVLGENVKGRRKKKFFYMDTNLTIWEAKRGGG
jgi:hypothetical protein